MKLEKLMQLDAGSNTAIQLAHKYVEAGEPVQAIAVLLESIEAFPEDIPLHLTCARYILAYQNQNSSQAALLLNKILTIEPDNKAAQELLADITAETDVRSQDPDLSDMPTMRHRKVIPESKRVRTDGYQKDRVVNDEVPDEDLLSKAFCCLNENDLQSALVHFQKVLEKDPDNKAAQDGFRKAYQAILNENERVKREKKGVIIGRTIRFLEAIKSVAVDRGRSKQQ